MMLHWKCSTHAGFKFLLGLCTAVLLLLPLSGCGKGGKEAADLSSDDSAREAGNEDTESLDSLYDAEVAKMLKQAEETDDEDERKELFTNVIALQMKEYVFKRMIYYHYTGKSAENKLFSKALELELLNTRNEISEYAGEDWTSLAYAAAAQQSLTDFEEHENDYAAMLGEDAGKWFVDVDALWETFLAASNIDWGTQAEEAEPVQTEGAGVSAPASDDFSLASDDWNVPEESPGMDEYYPPETDEYYSPYNIQDYIQDGYLIYVDEDTSDWPYGFYFNLSGYGMEFMYGYDEEEIYMLSFYDTDGKYLFTAYKNETQRGFSIGSGEIYLNNYGNGEAGIRMTTDYYNGFDLEGLQGTYYCVEIFQDLQ